MKLIRMGRHSIQFKIWRAMLLTILIMLAIFTVINMTVLSNVKDAIYYDQLENAAEMKLDKGSKGNEEMLEDEVSSNLITHISISFENNEKQIYSDRFTSTIYNQKDYPKVIPLISEEISATTPDKMVGRLIIDGTLYYYYVSWIEEATAIVFFLPKNDNSSADLIRFAMVFVGLAIISYFVSSVVARRLADPIKALENFADETAHRHWDTVVPQTNTEEIQGLAISLESMRDSLKIAEERDRQFLQSTSHDLKTPVMVIKGYAQALLDGVEIDSGDSAAMVIKNESEKLERRIMQLLRLNTLGHSLEYTEERDYVSVDRMINSLAKRCGVIKPSIDWALNLESLEIVGDSEALVIAFENIFENQLRYAQSMITVSVDSAACSVTIENDGPHFTVEDPMVLFDSYKKDEEGKFGLGLAIVWQVVNAHKGAIKAMNTDNGVAFVMTFKGE